MALPLAGFLLLEPRIADFAGLQAAISTPLLAIITAER